LPDDGDRAVSGMKATKTGDIVTESLRSSTCFPREAADLVDWPGPCRSRELSHIVLPTRRMKQTGKTSKLSREVLSVGHRWHTCWPRLNRLNVQAAARILRCSLSVKCAMANIKVGATQLPWLHTAPRYRKEGTGGDAGPG